jgi:hypothetical protein
MRSPVVYISFRTPCFTVNSTRLCKLRVNVFSNRNIGSIQYFMFNYEYEEKR